MDVMQNVPELMVNKRMSQAHERTEESARMVHYGNEGKTKHRSGGGYRRDEKMEKSKHE